MWLTGYITKNSMSNKNAVKGNVSSSKNNRVSATASAQAFMHLAHEVIEAVDRRNSELPPTERVHVK